MNADAIFEFLLAWCPNCDGRHCMSCVLRDAHEKCAWDCPDCEPQRPNVTFLQSHRNRSRQMADELAEMLRSEANDAS